MLLSADNDSHANETTAKPEPSLSLFGPIFLAFQQSLICWQKCLGPLTAKVTESTTHPADSKHGIWGMAFKQWLSHKPFCHQMLWKAYRLMIFFLGLQRFESLASLPRVPSTLQAWVTADLFAFPALYCGMGVAGVLPTNYSSQGFKLFICGGTGGQGQRQDSTTLCVLQGRFLDLIVSRESCAQILKTPHCWGTLQSFPT